MADPTPQATQKPTDNVRLVPGCRAKLEAIQQRTRLAYGVIVDVAFDEYMAAHGISMPESKAPAA